MGRIAKRFSEIDMETGEVLKESVKYGSSNGDGWVIAYTQACLEFVSLAPDYAIRAFFALANRYTITEIGIKTTKKAIADELGLTYRTSMRAFKWLKENGYVKERKKDGQSCFLLNPNVVTWGRNKDERLKIWYEDEKDLQM